MRRIILLALIILGLILVNFYSDNLPRNTVLGFVEKPFGFLSRLFLDLKVIWLSFVNYSKILEENELLNKQNSELIIQNFKLKYLQQDNDSLKKQLSISDLKPYKLEPVRIFLFSYDLNSAGAFIDKGEDYGITNGQAIIYSGNILIGIVTEVFSSKSKISLTIDPGIEINSKTVRGSFALAKGAMNRGIILDFIAKEDELKEEELILTNGLDGLPEDLLIGNVRKIEVSSGELFKRIFVKPAFQNIKSLNAFVIMR